LIGYNLKKFLRQNSIRLMKFGNSFSITVLGENLSMRIDSVKIQNRSFFDFVSPMNLLNNQTFYFLTIKKSKYFLSLVRKELKPKKNSWIKLLNKSIFFNWNKNWKWFIFPWFFESVEPFDNQGDWLCASNSLSLLESFWGKLSKYLTNRFVVQ
jgi:hypothetical protein